jgi:hypothetical protein
MDRLTNYFGQIPLETDLLHTNQNTMVALAKFCAAVLGTTTIVNGFTCTPTTPATLSVVLTPGEIYQLENLEATAWSSLPADNTHSIVKQGIQLNAQTFGITPPGTFGFSQVFLLEVQYGDLDTGLVILPYFNSANPSAPFSGPGNSGTSQTTVRQGIVSAQIKAGNAAITGTQIAPTADAGWTGMFLITVANGAATITSGNIVQLTTAPFIPATLPAVPADVQAGAWIYATDTGTPNNLIANVTPALQSLTPGTGVRIKVANQNSGPTTFNVNGLGANAVHRANGAALASGDINAAQIVDLVFDGSAWQISNYFGFSSSTTNNNTFTVNVPYCVDSSVTPNVITASFSPAIVSLAAGLLVEVKIANMVTGPTTIAVNALAAVNVTHVDQTALTGGELVAGEVALLSFDGTQFQIVNHLANSPVIPVGNPTLFVRTDGNDNNTGMTNTPSGAMRTIQAALIRAENIFALQAKTLTVQMGIAGTYAPFTVPIQIGSVIILGDPTLTNPQNFIISNTVSGTGVVNAVGSNVTLRGLTITSSNALINLVEASFGGSLFLDTVRLIQTGGTSNFSAMIASPGGSLALLGPVTVIGNFASCINISNGTVTIAAETIALSGNTFTTGTVVAAYCGVVNFSNGGGFSGSAVGQRFNAFLNAIINTNGGGSAFIPGTSPGVLASGAQYS